MGERQRRALRLAFDRSVKLEFHGARVTSDAGLLPYRELDEIFGLTSMGAAMLRGGMSPALKTGGACWSRWWHGIAARG